MLELLDRYRHKIKSAEELRDIIGPRPRKKRVIMCHGVFDVVHPGHIRHLLYARSKADLLIASITAGCGFQGRGGPDDAGPDVTLVESGTAELGTGAEGFQPLVDEQELGLWKGPQGGYHFIVHARMQEMAPGQPDVPTST